MITTNCVTREALRVEVVCVSATAYDLGESLRWDGEIGRLFWIDAWRSVVHSFDPATRMFEATDFSAPLGGRPIGFIASKVVQALSLGYFIMLLSTLGGLKNVDRDLLLMSRLFGATNIGLFRYVRLPWALPGIFAGLKLTLIYCSAGVVIGEMIAARSGLGLLVQTFSGRLDVAGVMAVILVIALTVMTFTSILDILERRLLAWSKGSTDVPG